MAPIAIDSPATTPAPEAPGVIASIKEALKNTTTSAPPATEDVTVVERLLPLQEHKSVYAKLVSTYLVSAVSYSHSPSSRL